MYRLKRLGNYSSIAIIAASTTIATPLSQVSIDPVTPTPISTPTSTEPAVATPTPTFTSRGQPAGRVLLMFNSSISSAYSLSLSQPFSIFCYALLPYVMPIFAAGKHSRSKSLAALLVVPLGRGSTIGAQCCATVPLRRERS
jgi:hypothetical protein